MNSKAISGASQDYVAAQKQIKAKFSQAKAKIMKLEKHTEEYVSDNPKKAVAIAAGIGAIIGAATAAFLMRDRKKDNAEK